MKFKEAISFDTTTDEWGNKRYGWFCEPHEQGGFGDTPEQREQEARAHFDAIPHDDDE